jgi:hypothetical protein
MPGDTSDYAAIATPVTQMLVEGGIAAAIASEPVGQEMRPGGDIAGQKGAELGAGRGRQHGDPGVAGAPSTWDLQIDGKCDELNADFLIFDLWVVATWLPVAEPVLRKIGHG